MLLSDQYDHERQLKSARMLRRCAHYLVDTCIIGTLRTGIQPDSAREWTSSPSDFAAYAVSTLTAAYIPTHLTPGSIRASAYDVKNMVAIFAKSICQVCALHLCPKLAVFVAQYSARTSDCPDRTDVESGDDVICHLFYIGFTYHAVFARYYLSDSRRFNDVTSSWFRLYESQRRGQLSPSLFRFCRCLITHFHLLSKAQHSTVLTLFAQRLMEMTLLELETLKKQEDVDEMRQILFFEIIFLLRLCLQHLRCKKRWRQIKNEIQLDTWNAKITNTDSKYDQIIFVSDHSNSSQKMNFICQDLIMRGIFVRTKCRLLLNKARHVWNWKKKDMQCLYKGCSRSAWSNWQSGKRKLYVCKGCKMAKYCSSSCQKKDWNHQEHKTLCRLLCSQTDYKLRKMYRLAIVSNI